MVKNRVWHFNCDSSCLAIKYCELRADRDDYVDEDNNDQHKNKLSNSEK